MKPYALWLANDGNFDLVIPAHPAARLASYTWGVVSMLLGPALIVTLALVGELEWVSVLGAAVVTVFIGGFGLLSAVSTLRMQRRVRRLSMQGRAAIAEVLDTRTATLGEESGTEATLRISGDTVPTFQTRYRGTPAVIERLGSRFPVIIDPTDRAYMIVRTGSGSHTRPAGPSKRPRPDEASRRQREVAVDSRSG